MNSTDVIAICSVVVAAMAFLATWWQAWLAHRHNRLSVRPLLVWHIARNSTDTSSSIRYSVRNLGLGPTVIRDRYFLKDSRRFAPLPLKTDEVAAFVASLLGNKVNYRLRQFGLPGKDAAIPSQSEFVIADVEFPGASPQQLEIIEELVGDAAFRINYESMYREAFEFRAPRDQVE